MAKVGYFDLGQKERELFLQEMFAAVASLKSGQDVENFFRDLLSLDEFAMVSRRVQIAKMLLEGFSHFEIIEKLKVGSTTIVKVDKWLNRGFDGYRNALKKARKAKGRIDYQDPEDFPFSFSVLRKRYPAHFWLINLLIGK